ncbi:MAG: ABC transporter permease, partial [Clostridia bacterium]|nr:ABC transporter permease [Clostridia bacterium]
MTIYDIHAPLPDDIANLPEEDFSLQVREHTLDEIGKSSSAGFYRDALRRLRQSRASIISFWIILVIIVLAIVVPNFTGYTYTQQNVSGKNLPPRIPYLEKLGIADGTMVLTNRKKSSLDNTKRFPEGSVLEIVREYTANNTDVVDVKVDYYIYNGVSPTEYHWFGTDYLGRDIMTRLFMGTRISLLIAFISVITNVIIGVIYGSVAGYYGGKVDMVLTHFAEV